MEKPPENPIIRLVQLDLDRTRIVGFDASFFKPDLVAENPAGNRIFGTTVKNQIQPSTRSHF